PPGGFKNGLCYALNLPEVGFSFMVVNDSWCRLLRKWDADERGYKSGRNVRKSAKSADFSLMVLSVRS
ncbi:MAG: hypothetical protein WAS33_01790, partial [Candidatus Promineifilaceae bacterium]